MFSSDFSELDEDGECDHSLSDNQIILHEENQGIDIKNFNLREFINMIAKYFKYSYKRSAEYNDFKHQFLEEKKHLNLYPNPGL